MLSDGFICQRTIGIVTVQGRGFDHIAFRDHNAVFVLGAEAIATNFLSVVLF